MKTLTLPRFDDFHCHFRLQPMLSEVLPHTAKYCGRAIAMPNTRPRAILTAEDAVWYKNEIENALQKINPRPAFQPLMTIEVRDTTTPEMIEKAKKAGAVAGKIYPLGVTTNSDEGLRNFDAPEITKTFKKMEEVDMLLLLHGELDKEKTLVLQREETFLPILEGLAKKFPKLKIVLEHVSSKKGVEMVKSLNENVAATITAHHLALTLNDVIGYGVKPHHACMPMPKDFEDKDALIDAATSGNPKFFLGSDSAPHTKEKKESAKGAFGVFTAPVLPELLAEIFEEANALDRLENFTSKFGAEFYGIPRNTKAITLEKHEWQVPETYGSIVPFKSGETLRWKLA